MKSSKEFMAQGTQFIIMQLGLALVLSGLNIPILGIAAFVFQVMGINRLIKGAQDIFDFKLARWAIVATFAAAFLLAGYLTNLMMNNPEMDPLTLLDSNKGVYMIVLIMAMISDSVFYFVFSGLSTYSLNVLEDEKLSETYNKIKLAIIATLILSIVSLVLPQLDRLTYVVAISLRVFYLYVLWGTRNKILQLDA